MDDITDEQEYTSEIENLEDCLLILVKDLNARRLISKPTYNACIQKIKNNEEYAYECPQGEVFIKKADSGK